MAGARRNGRRDRNGRAGGGDAGASHGSGGGNRVRSADGDAEGRGGRDGAGRGRAAEARAPSTGTKTRTALATQQPLGYTHPTQINAHRTLNILQITTTLSTNIRNDQTTPHAVPLLRINLITGRHATRLTAMNYTQIQSPLTASSTRRSPESKYVTRHNILTLFFPKYKHHFSKKQQPTY
jgi:hypothetical protein